VMAPQRQRPEMGFPSVIGTVMLSNKVGALLGSPAFHN
jgi:hypothetical protein